MNQINKTPIIILISLIAGAGFTYVILGTQNTDPNTQETQLTSLIETLENENSQLEETLTSKNDEIETLQSNLSSMTNTANSLEILN